LRLELACPANGACDVWDRLANLFLVQNPGASETVDELWRYITPYGATMCMLVDVTQFANLLAGPQTVRSFIDTWVGPNSGGNGQGWRVTATFIFEGATKSDVPDHIYNIWPYASVELGNPDNTVETQVPPTALTMPATVSRAELRLIVTGHGQGNYDNCGEFCNLTRVAVVNGATFSDDPWRSDCAFNPIGPNERGTWKYQRDGWCPGAVVVPDVIDVKSTLTPGATNNFAWHVYESGTTPYVNTCRPGNGGANNQCAGCAFNSNPGNCDYDGSEHTEPMDYLTAQLWVWE
jgi:hypothetical protein